jgi:hypothetical protein
MKLIRPIIVAFLLAFILVSCEQNEHAPSINDQEFMVSEKYSRYLNATIIASDKDGDQNLSFEIIDGNEQGIFMVHPGKGEITVAQPDLLDYETTREHFFKVSVSDNHPKNPMVSSAMIRMYVRNDNEISDKLVAYYNFDNDATDQTSNMQHGIVFGAQLIEAREEESQMAYFFDGTDDYIRIPDQNLFSYPKGHFSISIWVQALGHKDSSMILCKGAGDQDREYALGIGSDSLLYFRMHDRGKPESAYQVVSTTRVNYTDWYHVVTTWDGYMINIYVNGEQEGKGFCDAIPGNSGSDLFIGTSDGSHPEMSFHGVLDDLHIYHRMLAPYEVRNLLRSSTDWWGWF